MKKIIEIMVVSLIESADLAIYQLKGVAQIWWKQWKENRLWVVGLVDWNEFEGVFLDRYSPLEPREVAIQVLINSKQGNMPAQEYSLKFTQLSKYALALVVDSRARMSKFVFGVLSLVVKECKTHTHQRNGHLKANTYSQQIEEEKVKKSDRKSKKARINGGDSSHPMSSGDRGHSQF